MRLKIFISCALILTAPLYCRSETLAGGIWLRDVAEPIRELRGQPYLPSCPDLLNANLTRQGIIEQLVENAATEHQVLQLLFDGGLILSATYAQAFQHASGISPQIIGTRAANRKIETLLKIPPNELIHFAWRVLVSEPMFHEGSSDTDWYYTPDFVRRQTIRRTQLLETLDGLKHSPHREAVEKALLDVTTQSLLALSRAYAFARASKWQKRANGWRNHLASNVAAGLLLAGSGALDWEFIHILGAAHPALPTTGLFFAGAFAFAVNQFSLAQFRNMASYVLATRYLTRARKFQRTVFVIPQITGHERIELANGLHQLEDRFTVAIPAGDLCESNICNLNPVQTAYLGELDFIQLKGDVTALFGTTHPDEGVKNELEKKLIERIDGLRRKFEFLRSFASPRYIKDGAQRQFLTDQINRNLNRLAELRLQIANSALGR